MKYIHIDQFHNMSGGGVGSVITDLCEALATDSDKVYVISLFRKGVAELQRESAWAKEHGINIVLMQESQKMGVLGVLNNLRKTLKELAKEDECCLFLHLKWGVLAGVLASMGIANIKCVEVYHSGYMNYKLQSFVCRPFIDHYISVSKDAKQQLVDWFHIKESKITVAYNGVDLNHIRQLASEPVALGGDINMMSVGRLSFEKGFLTSIEAYGGLKEEGKLGGTTYTMIGKGDQMEKAREMGKGYVNFTGLVPRDSVYSNIAGCDVMILPSWWEGNSILLLEVLAIGKAMIISDIPSFREVLYFDPLADNEICRLEPFGVVFRAKDVESCKAALMLITENRIGLKNMANYVRGLAGKFSITTQVSIYKNVADLVFNNND